MHTMYLEDFEVGQRFKTRAMSLDEPAIMDFARQFDPQPIHTDREAAAEGPYGGIIASGFHTAGVIFRLWIDLGLMLKSSLGGPGIEDLKWVAPVRPEDTLHAEVEVTEVRPSKSKPDRGIVRFQMEGFNQRDEMVISFVGLTFIKVKPV